MKKVLKPTVLLLLFYFIVLAGCSSQVTHKTSKSSASVQQVQGKKYTHINPNEIEWLTMQGGKHITTKVLFQENASDKINKIIDLINTGTNKKYSTQEEIRAIYSGARPIRIAIKMKDETKINVWSSYKKNPKGPGMMLADDCFILNTNKNGKDEYYTILSKDVANYLRQGWQQDMPYVKLFTVAPYRIKAGEKVVLTGDGCTENEVSIFINKGGIDKYLIAKVTPVFGAWKWEGTISRNIKTLDGKQVDLEKDIYGFTASMGQVSIGTGIIDFTK